MYPSDLITSPEPVPDPSGPLAAIVTTEGTTWLATEVTWQELTVPLAAGAVEALGDAVEPDDWVDPTITPPITPPTTRAVPAAAQGSQRRWFPPRLCSLTPAP
jgi:hypothetical protein